MKRHSPDRGAPVVRLSYGQQHALVGSALRMLSDPNSGALAGLLDKFRALGLEESVASWIGDRDNLPLSSADLVHAVGRPGIRKIAETVCVSPALAAAVLARVLPHLVDRLTPEGTLPDAGELSERVERLRQSPLESLIPRQDLQLPAPRGVSTREPAR